MSEDGRDGGRDLAARDLEVFWHPASQMRDYRDFPPVVVTGARGCRLELADGRAVLDGISSWWCKSLGHGHPRLRRALESQLAAFEHVITAGTTSEPLVRLCERLLEVANAGSRHFGKVFLADNGSTAVEVALKMALQAQAHRGQPQRTRFAALANGYHGETVGALSVGDLGLYAAPFAALTFPVVKLDGLPYRSGPDDPRWEDVEAEWPAIERQLAPHAGTLAAVIYEPVLQAAGGMRLYSPALLAKLRAWARAHDVYLIADEIAAGMGRLGAMLASHLTAPLATALPDFVTLSKGLTGGFLPLSAVLATDEVYALFDGDLPERAFLHSNTYAGNALGVAVALAALDTYRDEDVLGQVRAGAAVLHAAMAELAAARPWLRDRRGLGMVAAIDLAAPPGGAPLDPRARTGRAVYREALRRGALLRPLGDTMYVFPPLNTSDDDLQAMVTTLAESIDTVLGGLSGKVSK